MLGLAADNGSNSAIVFDADSGEVLAVIALPTTGPAIGDALVLPDQSLGFVTDFANQVFVIDLQASPPRLADGVNPIRISNAGEDLSLSADARFLLVTDGALVQPVSVVDISLRAEVTTLDTGADSNSVDVCRNGSVLVTSFQTNNLQRLVLDEQGGLSITGENLPVNLPFNTYCAPDDRFGLVLQVIPAVLQSFSVPGLTPVSTQPLSSVFGISALFNPAGDRIYARSSSGSTGALDVFPYDSDSGEIGPLQQSSSIDPATTFFGIDQLAIRADGTRLYLPQNGRIDVLDANDLGTLFSISGPGIVRPTGITLPQAAEIQIDIKPGTDDVAPINLGSNGVIPLAILGSDRLQVGRIDFDQLEFGPGRASAERGREIADTNGDGLDDLIVRFRTQDSGIQLGDSEACVSGRTLDGLFFRGCDDIRIVPSRAAKH